MSEMSPAEIAAYYKLRSGINEHQLIILIDAGRIEKVIERIAAYNRDDLTYIENWLDGGKEKSIEIAFDLNDAPKEFNPLAYIGEGDNITNIVFTVAIHKAIEKDEPTLFAALLQKVGISNTRAAVAQFFELTNFIPERLHGDGRKKPEILKALLSMEGLANYLDQDTGTKIYTALAANRETYRDEQARLRDILGIKEEKKNWDIELPGIIWKKTGAVHMPAKLGTIQEVEEIISGCSQEAVRLALEGLIGKKPDDKVPTEQCEKNRQDFMAMVDYLFDKLRNKSNLNITEAAISGDDEVFKHLFSKLEIEHDVRKMSAFLLAITASTASSEKKQFILDRALTIPRETLLGMAINTVRVQDENFFGSREKGLIGLILKSEHANLITGGNFEVGGKDDILFIAARAGRGSTEGQEIISKSIGLVYRLAAAGADITAKDESGSDAVSVLKNRISKSAPQLLGDHRFQQLETIHQSQLAAQIERARAKARVDVFIEEAPRIAAAQTDAMVARILALGAAAKEAGVDPNLLFQQPGILALPDPNGLAGQAAGVQRDTPSSNGELRRVGGTEINGG